VTPGVQQSGVFVLAIFLAVLAERGWQWLRRRAARQWPVAEGRVVSAEWRQPNTGTNRYFVADLAYSYVVGGQYFAGYYGARSPTPQRRRRSWIRSRTVRCRCGTSRRRGECHCCWKRISRRPWKRRRSRRSSCRPYGTFKTSNNAYPALPCWATSVRASGTLTPDLFQSDLAQHQLLVPTPGEQHAQPPAHPRVAADHVTQARIGILGDAGDHVGDPLRIGLGRSDRPFL